ncbi:MAG TPA: DUF3754 domain-containing protein [Gemmataceae bacterium]|nr:DUF3754 domain-containing protein [Gemmataceae bacterium]
MGELYNCQHFIPLEQGDLIELLCADRGLTEAEREQFRALCERVAEAQHAEYHRRLRELKASYAPFDPDADKPLVPLSADTRQHRLNDLYSDFAWLLERAHFKHLSREEIEPVLDSASAWGIRMDVDFSAFEHVAIFARGDAWQTRTLRRWWRLSREEVEVPVFRRLVLVLKLRQHPRLRGEVDTEHVFLKVFKDIPKLDVMMLLPGARVRLTAFDRGKIGMPLVGGLALTLYNLLGDLMQAVQSLLLSPNAAWGLAAAGLGYGYKSFYGYQQTKQRYHLTLTQSLYFQNLDSNAGVLTRLLDEAEEQECRTAVLAYFCLWRFAGSTGSTAADLDAAMELYLDRYADVPLLCQPGEALAKLRKLGLVEEHEGRCRALPPPRAAEALRG